MSLSRRDFILGATATAAAGVVAVENLGSDDDPVNLYVDLDRMHAGTDEELYANIYARAEKEGLDSLGVEVLEPDTEHWAVLEESEASGSNAEIRTSYSPDVAGDYAFRAVAEVGEEQYISDQHDLEVFE